MPSASAIASKAVPTSKPIATTGACGQKSLPSTYSAAPPNNNKNQDTPGEFKASIRKSAQPGSIRALAHADINLLTLLPAPEVAGLQLRDASGEWVDLEHDPGLVIVNVGEMLQAASGGYYPATMHRVVVRDPDSSLLERWSVPMFFHPQDGLELRPGVTASGLRAARVEEYRQKGWLVSAGGGARPAGLEPK